MSLFAHRSAEADSRSQRACDRRDQCRRLAFAAVEGGRAIAGRCDRGSRFAQRAKNAMAESAWNDVIPFGCGALVDDVGVWVDGRERDGSGAESTTTGRQG